LDMGEPIKIADLARNMIRLSGREPDKDIEIRFTGLRPGEKLFEELSLDAERIEPSYHEKIHIFRGKPLSRVAVRSWVDELEQLIEERDECAILHHLKGLVPEYRPVGKWAAYFESSEPQLAPLPLSASA
ncbi:MAG: polysaccharide biosynthesis protein, partial [Acidobacteriaceae bacterium]|nr:polysaccharide biosynthesis protein [Acidobacteriaceae bacterium]